MDRNFEKPARTRFGQLFEEWWQVAIVLVILKVAWHDTLSWATMAVVLGIFIGMDLLWEGVKSLWRNRGRPDSR